MSRRFIGVSALAALALVTGALWAHPSLQPLPANATADLLIVEKRAHRLSIYSHGSLLREYSVSLGREPLGAKQREGDRRTPEGRYVIDRHNASSTFHKALHVSYPSPGDITRARAGGYAPGGEIMVHGLRNGLGWLGRAHLLADWTVGCIAVTNGEIDELYRVVPDGTPIELRP
jgi:murein L,D-transpeptidase YafK